MAVTAQVGPLQGIPETMAKIERSTMSTMMKIGHQTGLQSVATFRSLTSELRPPARKPNGDWTGTRYAHPGHWADISGHLALSYGYRVIPEQANKVFIELSNSAEYAGALEKKLNYWVIGDVTEEGGPVMRALHDSVQRLAPDWTWK